MRSCAAGSDSGPEPQAEGRGASGIAGRAATQVCYGFVLGFARPLAARLFAGAGRHDARLESGDRV
jgi:hypothetical protein